MLNDSLPGVQRMVTRAQNDPLLKAASNAAWTRLPNRPEPASGKMGGAASVQDSRPPAQAAAVTWPNGTLLRKVYYFHDIRVMCQTNHSHTMALLDELLGIFPEPPVIQGEVTYRVHCYTSAEQFPVQLPQDGISTGKVRLLTNTLLRYYRSRDNAAEYQSYEALSSINGAILSIIQPCQRSAHIQLEKLEQFQLAFLRRYPVLLALGQLLYPYGYEACHAAAISAPWDDRQGALIIGESGSGKTTFGLGCASSGYGLLGDDLVMLHQDSRDGLINAHLVTPQVSVRPHSLDLWKNLASLRALPTDERDKRYCAIEQVCSGATRLRTPVRLLLFLSLSKEAVSAVRPLNKAHALQTLLNQCMSRVGRSPQTQETLFRLLSALVQQADAYRVDIAYDATDGPQIIRSLFSGGPL